MAKKKIKTIAKVVDAAATILQKLVRVKAAHDNGQVQCVTCNKWDHWKEMQGGHWISRRHTSYKLDERNIHPQCPACNGFLMKYGNGEAIYTTWMIDYYGRDTVDEMLANKNQTRKYTRTEVADLVADWKEQLKHHEGRAV